MNVKLLGVFVFGVDAYLYRVQPGHFLALLDYVSRAHGMGSVVRRPSAVRLWHRLSLNLLHGFLSDFGSCFPWAICRTIF